MSEQDHSPSENFAALLAEYEQSADSTRRREPRVGDRVSGRILSIGRDAVFVDLGAKTDGMLEIAEVRDEQGQLTVAVGDEIEARVVDAGGKTGCVVLRRTLGRGPDARAELEQAYAHRIPVEGLVAGVNKGGVEVQIAGVRAFCPISQLDLHHVADASVFVGQRLAFRITRYEAGGPRGHGLNLVVSRRVLLEEEQQQLAVATRAQLEVGAVLKGRVTALKDYGAFVDLGGIEGMLHVSELGFTRVNHPKDALTVGQEITVQVLKIEKSDDPKRSERISLSLKALERDPWQDAPERFPEGARVRGTVVRVESFGAFVELAPAIEGLLHVSELGAGRNLRHAREAAQIGQSLTVTILGVDPDKRRISLGLAREDDGEAPPAADLGTGGRPPGFGTFADLLSGRKKPR